MKKVTLVLLSLVSVNAMAYQLNNGKIIEPGHFEGEPAFYKEIPIVAMAMSPMASVNLGAQADDLHIAADYHYHTTTNHTVYIVNHTNKVQNYEWHMESCPALHNCKDRWGTVQLNPGGEFCESGAIQPKVSYESSGAVYTNVATTYSKGHDPHKVQGLGYIFVS
jgi:hypothetical protein